MVLVSRPPLIGIIVGRNRCVARPPTPPTPPMPPSHPKTNRRLSNTQRTGLFRHERHAAVPREIVKHIRTHSACWLMHISHTQTRGDDTGGHLNSTHACSIPTTIARARTNTRNPRSCSYLGHPTSRPPLYHVICVRACVILRPHTHTHTGSLALSLCFVSQPLSLSVT